MDKDVFLSFKAEELDLAPFGSTVFEIHQLQGKFNAEVSATGTLENLNTFGFINIDDASFITASKQVKILHGVGFKI